MKKRRTPRYVPTRPAFIRVDPPDPDADGPRGTRHAFHVPMLAASARLAALLVEAKLAADADGIDLADMGADTAPLRGMRHAVIAIESACAVIGVCWWHPEYNLEVNVAESWRNFPDIRDYGSLVWEEFEEAGYTQTDIGTFLTILTDPILTIVAESGVESRANFTEVEAQKPN